MLGGGAVFAVAIVSLLAVVVLAVVGVWTVAAWRKGKAAVTGDQEYRRLAEEYRRLAELTITAREQTDLKIADLAMRIDQMRDQLDSVQRILKDVE